MWSWVSRGFTTIQQLADWHFDGNYEVANQALAKSKDGMAKLYSIEHAFEDPEQKDEQDEDEIHGAIIDEPLSGELITYWAITNPEVVDPTPIPLPRWFQLPIDHAILVWKKRTSDLATTNPKAT